jgi:F0F1-type ATP synthase epsilon subunit
MSFKLILKTPWVSLSEGEIDAAKLSTLTGELEILPEHTSLIGIIDFSKLQVRDGDTVHEYYVRSGALQVANGGKEVRILAQDIGKEGEMHMASLEEYLAFITEKLSERDLSDYQIRFLESERLGLEKQLSIEKQ